MSVEDIEQKILQTVLANGEIEDTGPWAQQLGIERDAVLDGALKRFASYGVLELQTVDKKVVVLNEAGKVALEKGSPEVLVFNAIPEGSAVTSADVEKELTKLFSELGEKGALAEAKKVFQAGNGQARQAKWIGQDKNDKAKLVRTVPSVEDTLRPLLKKVKDNAVLTEEDLKVLRNRRVVDVNTVKTYKVTKGPKYTPTFTKVATDLTSAMLASGSWKDEVFKPFNFDALGRPVEGGHLHPLMKVRSEIREIFIGMGFEEMPTNNYVESSFWNFDALYTPQQHPVRDVQDTFFVTDPATTLTLPMDYVEAVKKVHAEGGFGSIGYRYNWKLEEAQKNILRTHTTAVSTRMLRKLAQTGFKPTKFFSIDRVFRNETLDATHLAEFHQIEGLVADYNMTLANLMGTISQFFQRMGINDIRFKPAFNPYTEPSMEIFGYHPILKRWVELGNSGMFRPEMLLALGLPENVRVIAWGLSLERPTMIKYGLANIRDIFGPGIDLKFVKENPICFIDSKI